MRRLLFLLACLLVGAGIPLLVVGTATGKVPTAVGLPALPATLTAGMLLSAPRVVTGGGGTRDLDLQIRASGDAVKFVALARVALWLGRHVLVACWVALIWLAHAVTGRPRAAS